MIVSHENPLMTYASALTAYASAVRVTNKLFGYVNRQLFVIHTIRNPDNVAIGDTAMVIWRDVVLRRCIDHLVRDATRPRGRADDVAAVLESSKKMYFGPNGGALLVEFATIVELQRRLEADPVRFKPLVRPGWTKQSHRSCCVGTRDAVRTLLLVRQRLKVDPKSPARADLPRDGLLDTWWLVAKFLPSQ
jgi:hypothetical protein